MKNVNKKLLAAIKQVGGKVKKTGYNTYSKYEYLTESDLNEAVLPALIEQGLLLTTSVISVEEIPAAADSKNRFCTVKLEHVISDVDSDERIVLYSYGTAADVLDKAIYKSYSGAFKYMLMKNFMISGDDSDPENDTKEVISKPQQANKFAPPAKQENKLAPKGFMAKKAEQAAAPAQQTTTGAKKPSFGTKKVKTEPEGNTEITDATMDQTEASEEDAAY